MRLVLEGEDDSKIVLRTNDDPDDDPDEWPLILELDDGDSSTEIVLSAADAEILRIGLQKS